MARTRKELTTAALFADGIKSLRQADESWEADFCALPKPLIQSETRYLGIVVRTDNGSLLAESPIEGRPKADSCLALLTAAMQHPQIGKAHRPRCLHVRGHRQWEKLFLSLEELGIQVSVRQELPNVNAAFKRHLEQMRETRRSMMVKPTEKQAGVEKLFPAVAKWVQGGGHIEIGDQEGFGFTVRAIDYGGLIFEDDNAETLAEALAALETGLIEYFGREGI